VQVHPVLVASGLLSASILGAAFGPRLLPERSAEAAQMCAGHIGFYAPDTAALNEYGNAFSAFQEEKVGPEIDQGNDFQVLDFEEIGGQVVFFYSTGC